MSEQMSTLIFEFILNYWFHSSIFLSLALIALNLKWISADFQGEWIVRIAFFLGVFSAALFVADWRLFSIEDTSPQKNRLLDNSSKMTNTNTFNSLPDNIQLISKNQSKNELKVNKTKRNNTPEIINNLWIKVASWQQMIIYVWLFGAFMLLTFKVFRFWQLKQLLSSRTQLFEGSIISIYKQLCTQINLDDKSILAQSSCINSPILFSQNEIIVPDDFARNFEPNQIQAALAHELAHIQRYDLIWRRIYLVVSSIFFFQPLNFLLTKKLYDIAEQQSDRLASVWTGDSRILAHTLAHTASNLFRASQAQWIPAMNSNQSQLLVRVERLLGINKARSKPIYIFIVGIVCLFMVATLPGCSIDIKKENNIGNIGERNLSFRHIQSGVNTSLKASLQGSIRFNAQESKIIEFPVDSYLDMRINFQGKDKRRILIDSRKGHKEIYSYYKNGKKRPFDESAQKWFASILPVILRSTGIDAKNRVMRIVNKGGISALTAELKLIANDSVHAKYLKYLFEQKQLTFFEAETVLTTTSEISSDFEMANILDTFIKSQTLNDKLWRLVFDRSMSISSDNEMANFLKHSIKKVNLSLNTSSEIQSYFFTAAKTISSDFEMRGLFINILKTNQINNDFLLHMLITSKNISSDFEMAELLIEAKQLINTNDTIFSAYIDAAKTISSDYEMKRTLSQLTNAKMSEINLIKIINLASKQITSDSEMSKLLLHIIDNHQLTEALMNEIYSTTDKLGDFEGNKVYRELRKAST